MNAKDYLNVMVKNLKNYTQNMKVKIKEELQLKLENSGLKLLKAKLKLVLPICFTKMLVMKNLTKKILELLKAQIYAQKLFNILTKIR